jgi:hypothetical protein
MAVLLTVPWIVIAVPASAFAPVPTKPPNDFEESAGFAVLNAFIMVRRF